MTPEQIAAFKDVMNSRMRCDLCDCEIDAGDALGHIACLKSGRRDRQTVVMRSPDGKRGLITCRGAACLAKVKAMREAMETQR